ncbi:MAG: cobyric acid synthase [Acidobacteria bacterium]|nr:MAG: cobyric acid synthase [Acidobacteriota bacterium]
MLAKALMVLGTASHVGKSLLTTGLGRVLSDEGYRVAPFKAQNMSLNSAATPDGREIGRAQALQAEACRAVPCAEMNPILLKPSSHTSSQVVVLGRIRGEVGAADYHLKRVEDLFPVVVESYRKLAAQNDIVILEGAGSPAEINLKANDIVNLRMAEAADAACLLVGDIDRGGVFASLLGTLELVEPAERDRIRGFVINKFRGDLNLLRPGVRMIAERLAKPCLGVVSFLADLGLDEEDGVALEDRRRTANIWRGHRRAETPSVERRLCIGVIALPHLANFTDFDALAAEPAVALAYVERPDEVYDADLIILPGSKQTLDDLNWLQQTGLASALLKRQPVPVRRGLIGICGGLQMLGMEIDDPWGVENQGPKCSDGLRLLPIRTILRADKVTRRVEGRLKQAKLFGQDLGQQVVKGYEIHVGETKYERESDALAELTREGLEGKTLDGAISEDGLVWGTYVHGLFDDDTFRHAFLRAVRPAFGLAPPTYFASVSARREQRLDRWAAHVRQALDVDQIKKWLGLNAHGHMKETLAYRRNSP